MKKREFVKSALLGGVYASLNPDTMKQPVNTNTYEQLLLQRYPGIRRNLKTSIWDKLEEKDIRKMPQGMNSIAWNIWHMARAEDVGLNRLVTEGEQVFDRGIYGKKLKVETRQFGTGMTVEEVKELSEVIDLDALKEYHEEVGKQTLEVFHRLDSLSLDTPLEEAYLHQVVVGEGVLHPNALWVEEFYKPKIRSWFLVHMGLTHSFEHLGQVMLIRKLLGYEGTR